MKQMSRFLAIFSLMTGLSGVAPAASVAVQTKTPVPANIDQYAQQRENLLNLYKDLNLDFEGDFPAFYWDHGEDAAKGHVAAPGGVRVNSNQDMWVFEITSADGTPVPVKSYNAEVQAQMAEMAEGRLPEELEGVFEIEMVNLNLGKLNRSNIPDRLDSTSSKPVYYVPEAARRAFQRQGMEEHVKVAERIFGPKLFYSLPIARQITTLDMIYPLNNAFEDTEFCKAMKADDWDGPNATEPGLTNGEMVIRESWASGAERGKFDKKTKEPIGQILRRYGSRRLLNKWGTKDLSADQLEEISQDIRATLPPGEDALAGHLDHIFLVQVEFNEQEKTQTPIAGRGPNGVAR